MSKYLFMRLQHLYDLLFGRNFLDLEGLMRQTRERYSENLEIIFYSDPNKWQYLPDEIKLFTKINEEKNQNILVVGCGAGREFLKLTQQNLFGIDTSASLLRSCKINFPNAILSEKIATFNEKTFDTIIISHHVYNHIQGEVNRINFIQDLLKLLKKNRTLFLSADHFEFGPLNNTKFFLWESILKIRWMRTKLIWEKGDTIRGYNGSHNPYGNIFFYHYFATEDDILKELTKLNQLITKIEGYWQITKLG